MVGSPLAAEVSPEDSNPLSTYKMPTIINPIVGIFVFIVSRGVIPRVR
jgi:hypothetical protein